MHIIETTCDRVEWTKLAQNNLGAGYCLRISYTLILANASSDNIKN